MYTKGLVEKRIEEALARYTFVRRPFDDEKRTQKLLEMLQLRGDKSSFLDAAPEPRPASATM